MSGDEAQQQMSRGKAVAMAKLQACPTWKEARTLIDALVPPNHPERLNLDLLLSLLVCDAEENGSKRTRDHILAEIKDGRSNVTNITTARGA